MSNELIGRLNPHAQDWAMLPPGFGSLSQQDIAMALGFIRGPGPRLLGRVRYAQQDMFAPALSDLLAQKLIKWGRNGKWKNLAPIPKLAELAVECYTRPSRCDKCKGIGQRMWGAKIITCPACGGSTWRVYRPADFASALNVDWHSWDKTWSHRLGVALDILGAWDRRCIDGFSRALTTSEK